MNKYFTIILILAIALGATSCSKKKKYHEEATTSEKSSSSSGSASSKTFTVNGVEFKMIKVDGGTFTMGPTGALIDGAGENEYPIHEVTLSTYYIGQTEVTQELWVAVMATNPSNHKGAKLPVEMVSWDDCQVFISKLNDMTGEKFRMPTEAEWEYAARGGKQSKGFKYSGSNVSSEVAWYYGNCGDVTHPVATKLANELGIYDMTGNVWEWCSDWYGPYSGESQTNPTGPKSGNATRDRVDRDGSANFVVCYSRVTERNYFGQDNKHERLGLRLVLEKNQ